MSHQSIYNALNRAGMTREGACALMGNMQGESGVKSTAVQIGSTKLSDSQYTSAADNGLIDFVHDEVGYGLCQWTHPDRKRRLLDYAKKCGVSVGDEAMQVNFAINELLNFYPKVFDLLCSSHDLYYLTQIVCTDYECPKYNNINERYTYAQSFMLSEEYSPSNRVDTTILVIQSLMAGDGYWDAGRITGERSVLFKKKLREWTDDIISM